MRSTLSPEGLHLEHSVEDQRGTVNAFIGLYAVVAAVALFWTALFQRDAFVLALGASVALAIWAWRIRRHVGPDAVSWTLSITREEIRHHDTRREVVFARPQVGRVDVSRRALGRAGVVAAIEVRDPTGRKLLTLSVPVDHQETVEAALEEFGWAPTER